MASFNNKFGMFIHFGPYAMTGLHEQALARYDISHNEYEKMAKNLYFLSKKLHYKM